MNDSALPGKEDWQHEGAQRVVNAAVRRRASPNLLELLLLLATPLLIMVDVINGALIRTGQFSLSQAVKVAYLALMCVLAMRNRAGMLVVIFNLLFDAIFLSIHAFTVQTMETVSSDLQWLLRFNIVWIGGWLFASLFRKYNIQPKIPHLMFVFVSLVLMGNLLVGAMGYGYAQYGGAGDEQIGSVGFIFAGNEMSSLLILCQVMVTGYHYYRGNMKRFLVWSLVFLAFSTVKATKTAMVGGIAVAISFPAFAFVADIARMRKLPANSLYVFLLIFVAAIVLGPYLYQLAAASGIFVRMEYFAQEYGLLFAIFSGREVFASDFWQVYVYDYTFIEKFFGVGRDLFQDSMSGRPGRLVEIDLLDILGVFGIFGVMVCYGYYLQKLASSFLGAWVRDSAPDAHHFILLVFMLGISLTAGHVLNSGLAVPYLALAVGVHMSTRKRKA